MGAERIRRLYRRPRLVRRQAVFDRLENYDSPLPGRAGGVVVTRPADDLLFLDQRIRDVALVVFVRKSVPEIQYRRLRFTTILFLTCTVDQ